MDSADADRIYKAGLRKYEELRGAADRLGYELNLSGISKKHSASTDQRWLKWIGYILIALVAFVDKEDLGDLRGYIFFAGITALWYGAVEWRRDTWYAFDYYFRRGSLELMLAEMRSVAYSLWDIGELHLPPPSGKSLDEKLAAKIRDEKAAYGSANWGIQISLVEYLRECDLRMNILEETTKDRLTIYVSIEASDDDKGLPLGWKESVNDYLIRVKLYYRRPESEEHDTIINSTYHIRNLKKARIALFGHLKDKAELEEKKSA